MKSLRLLAALPLFGAFLVPATLPASAAAADPYAGSTVVRGTVISVGRADSRGDTGKPDIGSGPFLDINTTSVFLNGGLGTKSFEGGNVSNAYVGIGFDRIIQLQAGIGDRGPLGRIRTDINMRTIYSFVTQTRQPARERTLADRLTFTYTAEKYSDAENEEFDNATIGIGLLYDWPFR